jgi:hypothetical protein
LNSSGHKLDLEPVWLVDLHHRAEVALAQPVFIYVAGEDYGVENLIRHTPTSG